MKFGIVTFPGSNCDQDMHHVLRNVLNQDTVGLWHKDVDLQNCDVIVLPGGFSYGDYLRSGAIAKFSRIMNSIINFANRGGFVIGICNGFRYYVNQNYCPERCYIMIVISLFVKTLISTLLLIHHALHQNIL